MEEKKSPDPPPGGVAGAAAPPRKQQPSASKPTSRLTPSAIGGKPTTNVATTAKAATAPTAPTATAAVAAAATALVTQPPAQSDQSYLTVGGRGRIYKSLVAGSDGAAAPPPALGVGSLLGVGVGAGSPRKQQLSTSKLTSRLSAIGKTNLFGRPARSGLVTISSTPKSLAIHSGLYSPQGANVTSNQTRVQNTPVLVSPAAPPTYSATETTGIWEWENEHSAWCTYSLLVSAKITAAKASTAHSVTFDCTNNQHQKHTYRIDFAKMEQENVTHSTKRRVRMKPLQTASAGVALKDDPQYAKYFRPRQAAHLMSEFEFSHSRKFWASSEQKGLDGNKLFAVAPDSNEYAAVVAQFMSTMSRATVDKLERIENGYLHESFEVKKAILAKEVGDKWDASMQRFLFHGTKAVDDIVNSMDGFLPLLSGSATGALHGNGVYFARDASYSDNYAKVISVGRKQMIIADVLIGRSACGKSGMVQPPLLPGEKYKRFNSLVNNISDPSIFVVQHSNHAYPAYVITYRR